MKELRANANFATWRLAHLINVFGDFRFRILFLFPILPAGCLFFGSKRSLMGTVQSRFSCNFRGISAPFRKLYCWMAEGLRKSKQSKTFSIASAK